MWLGSVRPILLIKGTDMTKLRIGCDPECFLINAEGKHISSIGYINASKWEPLQIADMPKGFTLQEDNVAIEYGIPPVSSGEELWESISAVMKRSLDWLPQLSFSKLSCTVFDADQMQHPNAHVFGCEPDFNAWTKETNPSPQPPHPFMRSAGGHVHVETKADIIDGVRAMDLFMGVPSVLMDEGEQRKQLYGKRGAFRPKPYGFEYRTLSNFWIFDKKYCKWVYDNTERALANLGVADAYDKLIERAINGGDKEAAKQLVEELHLEVV